MTTDSNIEYLKRVERGAKRSLRQSMQRMVSPNSSVSPKSWPVNLYTVNVPANEYLFASRERKAQIRAERMSEKLSRWMT